MLCGAANSFPDTQPTKTYVKLLWPKNRCFWGEGLSWTARLGGLACYISTQPVLVEHHTA